MPSTDYVVYYLMDGHYRATRHAATCGTLKRAQSHDNLGVAPFPSSGLHAITDHHVVELEIYERLPDNYPTPKDHGCVQRQVEALWPRA